MRHRLVLMLVPVILAAAPAHRERPAPTGLKILAAPVLEPATELGGRPVALTVQNVTNKTIVAVVAEFEEFRADGTNVYFPPQNASHGVGMDFDGPDPAEPTHKDWIRPGQVTSLRLFSTGSAETASVKATITGLIYEDRTSEGSAAQMIFQQRRAQGIKARESAEKESSPKEKARFKRWAEWYETHQEEVEQ